jgi:hypothetical protein
MRAGRLSPTLASMLADGIYLTAWPRFAALLPPLAALLGLWLGWTRVGYYSSDGVDFMFSLVTVLSFAVIGQFGAGLGVWMWAGFVFGDLHGVVANLSSYPTLGAILRAGLAPRILADGVLLVGAAAIPFATGLLTQASYPLIRRRCEPQIAGAATGLLRAAIAFLLVYCWIGAAGVLTQGVFTWAGASPRTHGLVQNWAAKGPWVAAVAGYAASLRSLLVLAAQDRIAPALARLKAARQPRPGGLVGDLIGAVLRAALLTLVCGSLLGTWGQAATLAAILVVALAARELAVRYPPWMAFVARFPPLARAALGFAVILLVSWNFAHKSVAPSFQNALQLTEGAVLFFAVLLPPAPDPKGVRPALGIDLGPQVAAALPFLVLAGLAWPGLAHAGYCTTIQDCASGDPGVSTNVLTGAGIVGALVSGKRAGGQWEDDVDDFGGGRDAAAAAGAAGAR